MGGSHGSGAPASGPRHTLVSLLEMAFGSATSAQDAISVALVLAGRTELPGTAQELIAFVRAHLLPTLSDQIGPRLTMALVDDLVEKLEPGQGTPTEDSSPPSSMPRPIARIAPTSSPSVTPRKAMLSLILVDGDRVGRTSVARALLRAQWDVTVVDSAAELAALLDAGEPVDAALVDAAHPSAHAVLDALLKSRPDAAIVARSADAIRTRANLADSGLKRFDVRAREAPAEELIDAIKRTRGG